MFSIFNHEPNKVKDALELAALKAASCPRFPPCCDKNRKFGCLNRGDLVKGIRDQGILAWSLRSLVDQYLTSLISQAYKVISMRSGFAQAQIRTSYI